MKRIAILAGVAAVIGVVVWLDRDRPTTEDHKRATERLFPSLDPGRIDRLRITREKQTFDLSRKQGWWLADGTRADDAAVEAVLSTLLYGRVERLVDPSLRKYVDTPRAQLSAGEIDLKIGGDAAGNGVYVLRGSDLLVAENRLLEVLQADFRSHRVALADPDSASTVQIGALALERHGGGWRILSPTPALADPEKVGPLLNALTQARAEKIEPGPAPSPAPGDAVTLDGKVQAHIAWEGCDKMPRVVRADGAILCFTAQSLAPLRATVTELRELRLTSLRAEDVDTLELEISGKSLSLKREDRAWRITAPADAAGPADDVSVRERIGEILKLRGRAQATPASPSLGRVKLAGGGAAFELTIARHNYEVHATRKAEDAALILPASALKLFDPDPMLLRGRRVDGFRPDQVSAVSGDGNDLLRDKEGTRRLVEALSELRAESIQKRNFAPRHTLEVTAGGVAHTYLLGPIDSDGCLVKTSESSPAYVIAPATCDVLYAPFKK